MRIDLFVRRCLFGCAVLCIVSLSIAASSVPSSAQESIVRPGIVGYSPAGITVIGHSEMRTHPDIATVTVTVETQSRDETEAVSSNAVKMKAVREALAKSNVAPKDIHTQQYSVEPQYTYNTNELPVLTGYTVTNSLDVTIRDLPKAGVILDKETQAGATVGDLSFDLSNKTHVQGEALVAAVADARSKADLIAGAAGVAAGRVLTISEGINGPPVIQPMMRINAMAAAAAPPPTQVSPQEILITADVTATFAIDYTAR